MKVFCKIKYKFIKIIVKFLFSILYHLNHQGCSIGRCPLLNVFSFLPLLSSQITFYNFSPDTQLYLQNIQQENPRLLILLQIWGTKKQVQYLQ